MELAIVMAIIAALGLICSIVIATNNAFGLRDRAKSYLRERLEVPTEEREIRQLRLENDRALFEQIRDALSSKERMMKMREHDFAASYRNEFTTPMHKIAWESRKPDFEFHDEELEQARSKLEEALNEFLHWQGKYTFTLENQRDYRRLPKDWQHRHPKKWREARDKINDAADAVAETYDAFVRKGRRNLGVN